MPNIYDNASDDQIVNTILDLEGQQEQLKSQISVAKNAILERKQSDIDTALAQKPEPFGAASVVIGNQKVTFTTPKKVEWDQDGLAQLYAQIAADPEENVAEYISVEYKVKEDAYKNWPSNLKEAFQPHRTVKPGTVAIKIEPVKGK